MSTICIICRNPPTDSNPFTVEHIVPESIGGGLVIRCVCKRCNSAMGSGFEGEVVDYPFLKVFRHMHDIPAKRGRSVPHPFAGVYKSDSGAMVRVGPNLEQSVVPSFDVVSIDKSSGVMSARLELDAQGADDVGALTLKYFALPNPWFDKATFNEYRA